MMVEPRTWSLLVSPYGAVAAVDNTSVISVPMYNMAALK